MKIMIAGLGSIGRRHLRNLLALGERDILLYRSHKSTLPDDELKGFPTVNNLEDGLACSPQAVIISNPTALHLKVALAAAKCGCHLLIEKPISHSLEGIDELRRVVLANNVKVLVGFQFRFHAALRQVQRWLQDGAIGHLIGVRAHYGDYLPGWHPWEDYRQGYSARADLGGGVILTLSHPLDYLRWLVGEVQSLCAFTSSQQELNIEVEDTAEIGLKFINGVIGSVHLNYLQRPPSHSAVFVGSEGVIHWSYDFCEARLQKASSSEEVFSCQSDDIRNPMFLEEMRHFLQVLRGEETPLCTLEDGVRALELALAALHSASEGSLVTLAQRM